MRAEEEKMKYDLHHYWQRFRSAAAGYYATRAGLNVLMTDAICHRINTAATTAIRD